MTRIPVKSTATPPEWWLRVSYSDKGNAILENKAFCMANNGNKDGLAKGRSMHLTLDGKKTICNINVEKYFKKGVPITKKPCKVCFKNQ